MQRMPMIALLLFTTVSCGSESVAGPEAGEGFLRATIDGAAYSADVVTATNAGGQLTVSGPDMDLGQSISVAIIADTPGTYAVDAQVIEGSLVWNTAFSDGEITITSIDANAAMGTFFFEAVRIGDAERRNVTGGEFSVTF